MNAILSNMLWLPKTAVPLERIKADLTVATTPVQGPSVVVQLYQEDGDMIGVPRAWGLKNSWVHRNMGMDERMSFPFLEWPQFIGTYRKGQAAAVEAMNNALIVKGKVGALLEARTGTGKTIMGTAVASLLHTPMLVIVHKEDLAAQWQGLLTGVEKSGKWHDPLFPGATVGHVQANKWDWEGKHMVTALAQTLHSRKDRLPKGFVQSFGQVTIDEGHRYPARTFEHVLRMFHARYRLAVSATWRRNDGMECVWHWHVGNVEHRCAALQMTGEYMQIPWNSRVTQKMFMKGKWTNTAAILTAIGENAPFNIWLAEQLVMGAKSGRQVLLCSHRTAQLSEVRRKILAMREPVTVGYYAGKVDGKTIKKPELETTKNCNIVLATFAKMAEGTDIPTLDTLMFGTPAADVEQVVGRIQRIEADKRPLLVVDPVWNMKYTKRLADKRVKIYRKLGFKPQQQGTMK